MKYCYWILLPLLIIAGATSGRTSLAQETEDLALTDVTVVDVEHGRLLPAHTVLIHGNRIQAVGPNTRVRIPSGTQVVHATGKYLIPGLWDMHVHLTLNQAPSKIDMRLLVANGVTGVREMVSDCPKGTWLRARAGVDCLKRMRSWQHQIEAGERLGPHLLALGGWPINGPDGVTDPMPSYFGAATAEQGRQLARHYAERVDFVKIYNGIPREGFFALVNEAQRLGLDVFGHAPLAISAIEASNAGQRSFEHARVFLFNCFPGAEAFRHASAHLNANTTTQWQRRMVEQYDPKMCQKVFRVFVQNGTGYVPTHVTRKFDAFADDSTFRHDPRSRYIPEAQWEAWNADAEGMIASDSSRAGRKAMMDFYTKGLEITGAAHRAGVTVMLGTDSGDSYVFPGFAVHDELQELVQAGLTPSEALKAATWNGAAFLDRTADFGSIETGKRADLVLLEANPLEDIRNTQRIEAVVLHGRYLDRQALDQLLEQVKTAARALDS